MNVSHMPYIPA